MRYRRVLVLVFALVIFVTGAASAGDRTDVFYDAEELQFLAIINDYRKDHGRKPLVLSDALAVSAGRHSRDMGARDFFAHTTHSSLHYPAGSAPWDRMSAEGYDYNTFRGENLAAGYESAEAAFRAWRLSPEHNRAMLDGHYRVIGIARVYVPDSGYGWYWTTDFGGYVDPSSHPARKTGDGRGIENGSMNDGRVWKQKATDGAHLITRTGKARLGGYNSGRDELSQKIRITEGAKLVYRIKITTRETSHPFDRLAVRLTDKDAGHLATLESYTDANAGRWRRESVNLSRFKGRTVRIEFVATTDIILPTRFYVDNVRVKR